MSLPRATYIIKKRQKFRTKRQLEIWDRFVQTEPGFFLLIVVVKGDFLQNDYIFSIRQMGCSFNYSKLNCEKKINHCERFKNEDTDNTSHKKILQLQMQPCHLPNLFNLRSAQ